MIIVSQDKKEIINFDRITEIATSKNNICITDSVEQKNGYIIATYETEERAKEILKEILNVRATFELFRIVPSGGREQAEMLDNFAKNRIILDTYEMPKE